MKKNIAIFISDEGYGHTIRQRSIIKKLLISNKFDKIKIFHNKNIHILKESFQNKVIYKKIYNNISTKKNKLGHLDIKKTIKIFKSWKINHKKWLDRMVKENKDTNIIISDFVPEAFKLGEILNINSYGVCHYTWDWFYSKILKGGQIKKMIEYNKKAKKIFFPPITEKEILKKYKKNSKLVNFFITDFKKINNKTRNCVFMDNGTKSNLYHINKTLPYLKKIKNIKFYVEADNIKNQKNFLSLKKIKNIKFIYGRKKIHNRLRSAKFIIARGGFNTLSESLVLKIPALLIQEQNNPEIESNIKYLLKKGYCSELKITDMSENIEKRIFNFLKFEYNKIMNNIDKANFKSNGSKQVVSYIIKDNKLD
jgi:uncharacterized protein (TIGR00661 family)